jgi:hypothetical protein
MLDEDGGTLRFQHICNTVYTNSDGDVVSCRSGDFTGEGPVRGFGANGVSSLGDLDGDGVPELAVGGGFHDDGCETPPGQTCAKGAVWIVFLNRDGTVKRHQKISQTDGGFSGELIDDALFGVEVATLEDLDDDDVPELAVGAPYSRGLEWSAGEVWILSLQYDAVSGDISVKENRKITQDAGGFAGTLVDDDFFGRLLAPLGDIDDDPETVETLVASVDIDEIRGKSQGALWFLYLGKDGNVRRQHKMRSTDFLFLPDDSAHFGSAAAPLGDLDGDGVDDMAVGAPGNDGGTVWILFLHADGKLKRHQKINASWGSFSGALDDGDRFGASLARLRETADGVTLAVGAPGDDDGGTDRGAVWVPKQ